MYFLSALLAFLASIPIINSFGFVVGVLAGIAFYFIFFKIMSLFRFLSLDETWFMPGCFSTRNYLGLKRNHPELDEMKARFIAIAINASNDRDTITDEVIAELILRNREGTWEDLASAYCAFYHLVAGNLQAYDTDKQQRILKKKAPLMREKVRETIKKFSDNDPNLDNYFRNFPALAFSSLLSRACKALPAPSSQPASDAPKAPMEGKESEFALFFGKYYNEACELLEAAKLGDKDTGTIFLVPLMFVLADHLANIGEKPHVRKMIYNDITKSIFQDEYGTPRFAECCSLFDWGVSFFDPFVHGRPAHMLFRPGHKIMEQTPVTSCIGAFLDIFYMPSLVENQYVVIKLPMHDIFELKQFSEETALPFFKLMITFCKDFKDSFLS